jgi:hypothetical protein
VEKPLVDAKSEISKNALNRIRGGQNDLGKGSSPGARARSDAHNAMKNRSPKGVKSKPGKSGFAEAWLQNPSKRSRPAAANRLAQQLQPGQAEGGTGLFGRFSARPTPDPSNPGCAGGPRSITVLSSQDDPSSSVEQSKEQKRNLPDARDGFIDVESHPKLTARYGQVNFKTPKHGKIHGLSTNENGKTPKTEENALALRDSLIDMPKKPNVIWYKEGMYQGGTTRGCDCVNLFDLDTNLIAVYQKQPDGTNLFLTTCKLTQMERDHLKATNGNFVTERILKEQIAVSTEIIENKNNNNGLQ